MRGKFHSVLLFPSKATLFPGSLFLPPSRSIGVTGDGGGGGEEKNRDPGSEVPFKVHAFSKASLDDTKTVSRDEV